MATDPPVEGQNEANATTPGISSRANRGWSADDVRHLRRLLTDPTARAMMDLACADPGRRVTFREVQAKAGRTFHQSRADLAMLTRLIRQRFDRDNWPVNVAQNADGVLTYDAAPDIATAWKSAE
jgi:hypothetical protein